MLPTSTPTAFAVGGVLSPPRCNHQHLLIFCQWDLIHRDRLRLEDAGEEFLLEVFADHGQAVLEVGAVVGNIGKVRHRDVDGAVGRKCNHNGIGLVADGGGLDIKQLIQQSHALVFMLGQDMGIGVRCKGDGCVAQNHGQGLRIHLLLHGTGGEGMPECMEGKVGQPCQLQNLAVVVPEGPGFNVSAQLVRDHHAAVAVAVPCHRAVIHLHRPPGLQILKHLGQQRYSPCGVLGLGGLDHDLRGVLAGSIGPVHLVQPTQRSADMQ